MFYRVIILIYCSQFNMPTVKKSALKFSESVLGIGSFGSVRLAEVKEDSTEKKLYKEKVSRVKLSAQTSFN